MWDEIFKVAITNGIFAMLFVALLAYVLRDGTNREKKYQETIEKLSHHLDVVEDIKEDVVEVKATLIDTKKRSKSV